MTVLFVSRCLPLPAWHGDRLILDHLLAGLRARGHRTVVAAFVQPGDEAYVAGSRDACDRLELVEERRRDPVDLLVRLTRPFPRRARQCWHPRMFELVEDLSRDEAPRIVHCFGGVQVAEIREAARGRRRVITPYESYTLWLERAARDAVTLADRLRLRVQARGAALFERRVYRGFDRVVVLTEIDAGRLTALEPRLPVSVIPNGVHAPEQVAQVAERRDPLMVFVGNFSYEPNALAAQRLAREVLPAVRASVPSARLALVGATPSPAVQALASPDVAVTGTVDTVWPWLQRARVFVSPLTRGAGMKNKVLEALAAGAPLVATRQSCDGLGVADGVHALLAEGSEALAAAAVRVLTDEVLAQALASRGRELAREGFSWPSVVTRYERLYAEVGAS